MPGDDRANPADLEAMMNDPSITLLSQAGLNIGYLAMNVKKPPFDKKEVRQAINMAIDRDAIIKEVYQGAGQKAKNLIPPTIWSYNDAVKDYDYNPEKAKEMLKGGGRRESRHRFVVDAGAAALQPQCQADGGNDAGRSRKSRHPRQACVL